VQSLNDPALRNKAEIEIFNQAKAAERIAELGILFQAVFDRKAPAAVVAPLVLARLQAVLDAANPAGPKPRPPAPETSRPATVTQPSIPGQRTGVPQFPNTIPGITLVDLNSPRLQPDDPQDLRTVEMAPEVPVSIPDTATRTASAETFNLAAAPFPSAGVDRQLDGRMSLGVVVPVDRTEIVAETETAGTLLVEQGPIVIAADPVMSQGNHESSGTLSRALEYLASFVISPAAADDGRLRPVPSDEPLPGAIPIPLTGRSNVPIEPIVPDPYPIVEPPRSGRMLVPPTFVIPSHTIPVFPGPFTISDGGPLDLGPIDYGANGVDLSRLDPANITLPAPLRNTLGLGGRYYNVFGGGASGIIDLDTGEVLQLGFEAGVGQALGVFGQLGEQPVPRPVAGIELRLTWPGPTGLRAGTNEVWAGPQFYARLSTEELLVAMNSWVALGRVPQVPWFVGTADWGMRLSWTDGFQWLNPTDAAVMPQPTWGWVPTSTNIIRGFVLLPRGEGDAAPQPQLPTLGEEYPGQLQEQRMRNLMQLEFPPAETDSIPRLGPRSDVLPEEQPVQLTSVPGVSIYDGNTVLDGNVNTAFLTQAAGYTGLGIGSLADSGSFTGMDSLFAGVAGLNPELLDGDTWNSGVVTTNLAGLAEFDPTVLAYDFDSTMDLSSMYA
jgi:hypothetical protein